MYSILKHNDMNTNELTIIKQSYEYDDACCIAIGRIAIKHKTALPFGILLIA